MPLGLDLAADEGPGLMVAGIASGSAAEAWNKQCRSNARQILPGDRLLSVNAKETGSIMREEARVELLLRLALQRGCREIGHVSMHASAADNACPWSGVPEMMPYIAPWPVQEAGGCAEPWVWQWPVCTAADMQVLMLAGVPAVDPQPKWKGTACRFEWTDEAKRLFSKSIRVTKTQRIRCGEFTFAIHAQQTSDERGGSSFKSSGGRGSVHVKCNSSDIGMLAVTVSLAGAAPRTMTHDFAGNSMCKLPSVFDFSTAVDAEKGTFTLVFELVELAEEQRFG